MTRHNGFRSAKKNHKKIVPLDPVSDRAWIKSNGLGVIAGEDLFQEAIKSYIEEARAQPLFDDELQQELVSRPSKGYMAIMRKQWKVCLQGKWTELALATQHMRHELEKSSAMGPANARRAQNEGGLGQPNNRLDVSEILSRYAPSTNSKKARGNAVRQTPSYGSYVDYVGSSMAINAEDAQGPAGRRRKRRQEPPEPYVAVNVFDTLHELVDTTGMAVAASYVKNKDFWAAREQLDQAKQGAPPKDLEEEMHKQRAATANARRGIRKDFKMVIHRNRAIDGIRQFKTRWATFVQWLRAQERRSIPNRVKRFAHKLVGTVCSKHVVEHETVAEDVTLDIGSVADEGSAAGGGEAADSIPLGTALLTGPGQDGEIGHGPSVMEEASFLSNDMMGAPSQAAIMSVVSTEETNENTLASESVVTGPPSALVDVATDVCRSKLRIADKRRRRIWHVHRPGVSVLTGECLEEPQTLTQWASSTLRKKGETLRELGVLKGLKQLHAEGMSAHTRKLVLDFYMAEQRNTDVVIREQKMFGLLSTGEMADFSEEDFAEAAAAGNFEYLSAMLTYCRRHPVVASSVPIDSRTATGYTAFHAAFLMVLEAEQQEAESTRMVAEAVRQQALLTKQKRPSWQENISDGNETPEQRQTNELQAQEEDNVRFADGVQTTADKLDEGQSARMNGPTSGMPSKTANFLKTVFIEKTFRRESADTMPAAPSAGMTAAPTEAAKREGTNPLGRAQSSPKVDIGQYDRVLALLIHHGANLNIFPTGRPLVNCLNPLHDATRMVNHFRMDFLLKHGARVDASTTMLKMTPLIMAAREGQIESMAVLMAHHAKLDKRDAGGRTALHHAARNGHIHAVRTLLLAGADRELVNNQDQTPAMEAKDHGHVDAFRTIMAFQTGAYRPGRLLDHLAMVHEAKSGESLGIDSMIYRRKEARAKLKSKRKKVKQGKTSSSKAPVTGDTHPSLAQSMGQLDFLNTMTVRGPSDFATTTTAQR